MTKTRKLISTALCAALCVVLPIAFHTIPNAGAIFLPMHIPVLLCGFLCGWPYGLACGMLGPVLSHLLTQMPPAALLPSMLCELAVYGLVTGLLYPRMRTRSEAAAIYVPLLSAMVCGRLVNGALNALIFQAGRYSLELWLSASVTTALPGIAIQLVVLPVLLGALRKAGFLRRTAPAGS